MKKRYGACGRSIFHVSVLVPSAFFFCETIKPFESVTNFAGTVMEISSVVFWLGLSIVGTHTLVASVSPCVQIWVGLSFSSPLGLIKYKPFASLIAALPSTFT